MTQGPDKRIPELDHEANRELAFRSKKVALIYVPISLLITYITDLKDYALMESLGLTTLYLVSGFVRIYLARNFDNGAVKNWLNIYIVTTLFPTLFWGFSLPLIFFRFGADWTLIITLLTSSGIVAGAVSSLSPRIKIFRVFNSIMMLPIAIVLLVAGEGREIGLGVLLIVFWAQMMVVSKYFHSEFWSSLYKEYLLTQRAEALEKAHAELAEANKFKSEFLANMSHEIRTPMNGIIGLTNLVLESEINGQQREYLDDVKTSGETLLKIINEILDFSKIEAGQLVLENTAFEPRVIINNMVKPIRQSIEKAGNTLVINVDKNIPPVLMGDGHRLWQVLTNLTGNAVKFTENGTITVSAKLEGRNADQAMISFSVSDTGIGISPEAQETIFNSFQQAEGDTSRKYGGTGLGLTISSRIAELMGGALTLASVEGRGSTFAMIVPMGILNHKEEPAPEPKPKAKASSSNDIAGMQILLVEDNLVNAKLASRLLEKMGAEVQWEKDGQLGSDACIAGNFDVVLMDIQMPVMDGFLATAAIRAAEKDSGNRTPIIALTAHALEGYKDKCLDNDMDGYITKPLNPKELKEILIQWVPETV